MLALCLISVMVLVHCRELSTGFEYIQSMTMSAMSPSHHFRAMFVLAAMVTLCTSVDGCSVP